MACFFQPREERCVYGSRQALVQNTYQPDPVFGKQGFRIEPEAGENLRAIDAVGTRRQVFIAIVAADEPVDLVGVELHNDIFLDPGTLVIGLLRAQVEGAARAGDLNDQLRSAGKIALQVVPDLPPQLGSDVKLTIRLRLPLLIQLDSRSVGAFDPRRLELVIKQPSSDYAALLSVRTTSAVTTNLPLSLAARSGSSNMMSSMISSTIDRRPRAPVSLALAILAISRRASLVNSTSAPSMSKKRLYCLTRAFLGSVMIWTRASTSRGIRGQITGSRPMNSGIKPNSSRSSEVTLPRSSPSSMCCSAWDWLPKPMVLRPTRRAMMCSSPTKVPPQMNRTLLVSIWMYCCSGCLRPPWGGTLATVPSSIFRSAC